MSNTSSQWSTGDVLQAITGEYITRRFEFVSELASGHSLVKQGQAHYKSGEVFYSLPSAWLKSAPGELADYPDPLATAHRVNELARAAA
jgi:hypothetical protein